MFDDISRDPRPVIPLINFDVLPSSYSWRAIVWSHFVWPRKGTLLQPTVVLHRLGALYRDPGQLVRLEQQIHCFQH